MQASYGVARRTFLADGAAFALGMSAFVATGAEGQIDPDKGVTAPEDLMKEHGVLHRCLLIRHPRGTTRHR